MRNESIRPTQDKFELTRIHTPSTLRRGVSFMPDGGSQESAPKKAEPKAPEVKKPVKADRVSSVESGRDLTQAWQKFFEENSTPVELRSGILEGMLKRGQMPPTLETAEAGKQAETTARESHPELADREFVPMEAKAATPPPEAPPEDPATAILREIKASDYADENLQRVAELASELVENHEVVSPQIQKLLDAAKNMRLEKAANEEEYKKISDALRRANIESRRGERFFSPDDIELIAQHPLLKNHLDRVATFMSKLRSGEFEEEEYKELRTLIATTELPLPEIDIDTFDPTTAMTEGLAKELTDFELAKSVLLANLGEAVQGVVRKEKDSEFMRMTEELAGAIKKEDYEEIERIINIPDYEDPRGEFSYLIEEAIALVEGPKLKPGEPLPEGAYKGEYDHVIEFVLEYGMERILSTADSAPLEDYPQFSLYVVANLDKISHMARVYDERRADFYGAWGVKRNKPDMFGYLVNLRNKRRIMHELFRGAKDPNTYLQLVTQALRKTGFQFVEKDVVGVADIQILYEQALASALSLKPQGWLTDHDFERVDKEVKALLESSAKYAPEDYFKGITHADGTREKRGLREWEVGRAALMGRSINAASQRRVVYAVLGELPENPDLLFKSIEFEYLARRLAPLKMFADRFFGHPQAKSLLEELHIEFKRRINDDQLDYERYGYIAADGTAKGLYGQRQEAFDILDLLITDPKSNSWRARLMFLSQMDFQTETIGGQKYTIREYLRLMEKKYPPTKGKNNVSNYDSFNNAIRDVIKNQRLFLGVLMRHPNLDARNKQAIWENVASFLPSRIAAFFPKETMDIAGGEAAWLAIRDKLWLAERMRVKNDAEALKTGTGTPHDLDFYLDALPDDMKLSDAQRAIVKQIQEFGKDMAPALVKIKQPFTAFLDDVPKTDWENTSDEDFNRILVSDQNDYAEGYGHILGLIVDPIVKPDELVKQLTEAKDKIQGPPGLDDAQKVLEPIVNAIMTVRRATRLSKAFGDLLRVLRVPQSKIEKFNLQARISDDEEDTKQILTALAQKEVISDDPHGPKDEKGRTQLMRMLDVNKANRRRQLLRWARILMYLLPAALIMEMFGDAVDLKEVGLA